MYTIYSALTVYQIVLYILEPHSYPDRNKDDSYFTKGGTNSESKSFVMVLSN